MKHKKPPIQVIILLVILILVGGYYGIQALNSKSNQTLLVSGTVEATEVTISSELSGRIAEVFVEEGAVVKKGDPLFRLDPTLLQGQRAVASAGLDVARSASLTASAALDTAKANYDLAVNVARVEASATRTQDWNSSLLPGYSLPGGYFSQDDLLKAASSETEADRILRDTALEDLNKKLGESSSADFVAAESSLLTARTTEQAALDVLNRARASANQELIDIAQVDYETAKSGLDNSQEVYDNLKTGENAQQIIALRLKFAISQERYEAAQDRQLKLEIGEASPKLLAARAALDQADKVFSQAGSAVSLAEAQLALIDLQIERLTVVAPCDGVILTRSIESGEMVNATSATFKIGKIFDLYITVFVPEEIYGTLSLGQSASLTVDSYPGEVFSARIVNIADQAEFTPRNVQTIEGRKATVFAVKLKLEDLLGRLKPGMPADITFNK